MRLVRKGACGVSPITRPCGCQWRLFEIHKTDVFGDVASWLSFRQITWCGNHWYLETWRRRRTL
jgi:hypothetical protein